MTDRPFHAAAIVLTIVAIYIVLTIAIYIAILLAAIDERKQPAIDTAELTGWFTLEGRN